MLKVEHELERAGAKLSHFIKTGKFVVVIAAAVVVEQTA